MEGFTDMGVETGVDFFTCDHCDSWRIQEPQYAYGSHPRGWYIVLGEEGTKPWAFCSINCLKRFWVDDFEPTEAPLAKLDDENSLSAP